MSCYSPLQAYRTRDESTSPPTYSVTFLPTHPLAIQPLSLPCGRCVGCRLEYSRQWALRCVHEAQLHTDNCFITLTFDNEHLHQNVTLVKKDFQDFMKRLRDRIYPQKVRYFHCGEYGEKYSRPHHHALLFGYDFPDKEHIKTVRGNRYFTSRLLSDLWPFGFNVIGDATIEAAAYVARYVVKKIRGSQKDEYYSGRVPEYVSMSRRPGIGLPWIKKYHSDVYPSDFIIHENKRLRPSRYYDKFYEKTFPSEFEKIKMEREESAHQFSISSESSLERLHAKHQIQMLRLRKLKRSYEFADGELDLIQNDYDLNVIKYRSYQLKDKP